MTPPDRRRTYIRIQMMGANGSCLNWNSCNVSLIQLTSTVCFEHTHVCVYLSINVCVYIVGKFKVYHQWEDLAQNRYFEDEAFIGYLKYLQYWQRPEYIKFIMYPHSLFFLELLQNANFRNAIAHPANKELAHRQQFYFWKNYRNNRLKHILPRPLPEPVAVSQSTAPPPAPIPLMANTVAAAASAPVPTSVAGPISSPMQYAIPSGSVLAKNDPRNSAVDRRKRKKDG